jgi:hypothetical protein
MPTPPPPTRDTESDGGSIFDKLIEDYGALAERAEDMVLQHVCGEIEMELRAHFFRCVFERGAVFRDRVNANLCSFDASSPPASFLYCFANYHRETEMQLYIGAPRRTLDRIPPSRQLRNRDPVHSHVPRLALFLLPHLFSIQPVDQDVDGPLSEDRRDGFEPRFGEGCFGEGVWGDWVEGGEDRCYGV